MAIEIDELLKAMTLKADEITSELSSKEIWKLIADGASNKEMGFNSEREKKKWIEDNPYSDIV